MAICDRKMLGVEDGAHHSFHLFAQLPIELRLKIWTYNLPGPRIIEIKCSPERTSTSAPRRGTNRPTAYTSSSPIPVNLHVCRESRLEALRRYQLLFGIYPQPGRIFFDPLGDTLYFGRRQALRAKEVLFRNFLALVQLEDLARVRYVAINEGVINYGGPPGQTHKLTPEQILYEAYLHLTNLEQLTFVCHDRNPLYSSDAVFVKPSMRNRILERHIEDAVHAIGERPSPPRPISWSVQAIAAEPVQSTYDQSILGYRGRRSSFFREFYLPQHGGALPSTMTV